MRLPTFWMTMIFISLSAACEKGPAPFIFPVREWVAGREAKAFNQLAHPRTPAAETHQQLPECFGIVLVPFGRKVLGQLPQHIGVKFFDTAQPGSKESHPMTPEYTAFDEKMPRKGESGKF